MSYAIMGYPMPYLGDWFWNSPSKHGFEGMKKYAMKRNSKRKR